MQKHLSILFFAILFLASSLWVKSQTLDLGNDTIICNFNGYTLDAGAGFTTYEWSTGATTQTITVFSSEIVTVTVTDAQNNVFTDEIDVYFSFPPIVNFEYESDCAGKPIQFFDNSNIFFDPLVSWLWDFGDGTTSQDLNPVHIYDTSGFFTVTLTVTNSRGCDSSYSTLVEIFPLPFVDAGTDTTVNVNEPFSFNATSSPNVTYQWQPPVFLNDAFILNPVISPLTNVTYTLTVTDSLGCQNSDTATVNVNLPPTAISRETSINPNSNALFTNTQLGNDANNDSLTITIITEPANGSVVIQNDSVFYFPDENFSGTDTIVFQVCDTGNPPLCSQGTIIVSVGNLRPSAIDDTVETNISETITFNVINNDTEFNNDQQITIDFISEPENGSVSDLNNGNLSYTPNFGFIGTDSFYYVICDNGQPELCDTARVYVVVKNIPLFIHNSFSPNGDGVFDFFIIEGIVSYPESKLLVFNRWGEVVFEATGYNNDFDGFTGFKEELPDATYYYHLDLKDGSKPLTGYLVLKR